MITGLDKVLAVVAMLAVILYLGILIWYVPQPALIVVCAATVLLAAYDFARDAFALRRPGDKDLG